MAFLDEVGKTLTDMGKDVAQKTKDVAEVLQLKAQLNSERSRLRDAYAAVGKAYFEQQQGGATEERFADGFLQIQDVLGGIAKLEEKINSLEGSKICPACGSVIDRDAAFCSRCGASVVELGTELSVVEDTVFDTRDIPDEDE